MNIPKYRAKKIDSDEYVVGNLYQMIRNEKDTWTIQEQDFWQDIEVDTSTLAIHFPDISTTSENVWYTMKEISKILKDYEDGKVEKS